MISLMTELSLILASANVFSIRWTCRVCSRISCLRVRVNERNSWISSPGTKLALISPHANRSAIHVASFTSVLRPGTFLMWGRIRDHQLERTLAEDPEHRHPIDAGRLHRHMRAPAFLKPRPQLYKLLRGARKSPALPFRLAFGHDPYTSHHCVFVHVQASHTLVQDIHVFSPSRCAGGIGTCQKRILGSVLRDVTVLTRQCGSSRIPRSNSQPGSRAPGRNRPLCRRPLKITHRPPAEKLHKTRVGFFMPVPTRNDGNRRCQLASRRRSSSYAGRGRLATSS